jgi:hypothetical protein
MHADWDVPPLTRSSLQKMGLLVLQINRRVRMPVLHLEAEKRRLLHDAPMGLIIASCKKNQP